MAIRIRSWLTVTVLLFCSSLLFAQEGSSSSASSAPSQTTAPKTDSVPKFGMGFQFGAVLIDGINYNTIRFQPDFSIGKFGIGLDINFEFDANGNFRAGEWNSWQAVLSKVLYVRYGFKGEPVYVKLGGISDFTFDDGFILNYYSNMFNYPAIRKLGIAFDLDFNMIGFETMVANVFMFDLFGMRAYYRPLINTDIAIFNKMEVGATLVADLGPQNPVPPSTSPYSFSWATNNTPVVEYGADVGVPLVDVPMIFNLRSYLDFAGIAGKGTGEAIGISGRVVTIVPYRLEFRLLQPQFLPSYFDAYYDSVRSVKYATLDTITNGYAGWLFSMGLALLEDKILAELKVEQSFTGAALPELTFNFSLDRTLTKIIGVRFTWNRKNIISFGDIFAFRNSDSIFLMGIDYYIADNLVLALDQRSTFQIDSTGNIVPYTSTSISTRIVF